MPRYRFRWNNLDRELLTALVGDKAEPGVLPEDLLRGAYGARPNEEFIRDKWDVLLERWLADEPTARERVVTAMRSSGVGDLSIDVSTPAGSLEYLGGLRNTSGLRRTVLREVTHAGEADRHDQDDTRADEAEQPAWPW